MMLFLFGFGAGMFFAAAVIVLALVKGGAALASMDDDRFSRSQF